MKSFLLVLIALSFFSIVCSQDAIILQSGRKIEGVVIVKGNEVHLVSKYGTIIYDASTVKVVQGTEAKTEVDEEANNKSIYDVNTFQPILPISESVITRSGRKLEGFVFFKGKEMFLSDLGGTVRIDPFVIASKEDDKSNKLFSEVISGEKCNVVLKSGRTFSGVVVEQGEFYYVSTAIGTVKVEKKNVDHVQKTGVVLNFKEEELKAKKKGEVEENANKPNTEAVIDNAENTETPVETEKKSEEMTEIEMIRANKKIEESLREGDKKDKEIKTVFENE